MSIKLINDTCFNANKYIKENSVNLFFCDPPYGVTNNKWDSFKSKDEFYIFHKSWIKIMYNLLHKTGSAYICCDWRTSHIFREILEDTGFIIKNRITWKRDKGRGSKTNWKNMHEDIWYVTKSKKYTFNIKDIMLKKEVIAPYKDRDGNPKDWFIENGKKYRYTYPGNLWKYSIPFWSSNEVKSYAKSKKTPNNPYQKHPTQKPKDLVKRCIIASSNENDLVCDFFVGSGTTMIAAKELHRNFIGFEKDKIYYDMCIYRLNNET